MTTRRTVLKGLGGAAAAPFLLRGIEARAAAPASTILVTVQLAGGNDGLNTVVPLKQYGAYQSLRHPTSPPANADLALDIPFNSLAATAFDANPAIAAPSSSSYAFNPVMTAMRQLYATGHLAVIAGVGVPLAEMNSLSHETAIYDWQTGTINNFYAGLPGWIGTTLDAAGTTAALSASISVSGDLPQSLNGPVSQPLVLPSPIDGFGVSSVSGDDAGQLLQTWQQMLAQSTANPIEAYNQAMATRATQLAGSVQSIAGKVTASDYPTTGSYLEVQLQQIARLILGGSGARAYHAVQGGYDTHSMQNQDHPGLLAGLSTALANFYAYLQAHGGSSNVVVATYSDFGRRPAANEDYGTDHGAASVAFMLGDPVKGGVYGDYPSLTSLDDNGNLQIQVDFRNVVADLISYLGGDPAAVLGGSFPRIGFV